MRLYLKLFSALISITMLVFPGCRETSYLPVGMVELPRVSLPVGEMVEKMSFKMVLASQQGEFSGVFMIKRMPDETRRVAFFSEVGMSYLEGSLAGAYPYSLEIRSVSPFISSQKVIQHLETALNILLVRKRDMQEGGVFKDDEMKYWIMSETRDGNQYWGRLDKQGRIDRAHLKSNKIDARFEYATFIKEYPSLMEVQDHKGRFILSLRGM